MMDRNRQGEIGRAMVKQIIFDHGIKVSNELDRELGNTIKKLSEIEPDLKVTPEELTEVYLELSQELMVAFQIRVHGKINSVVARK